jgi:hypothetical protein
MRICFYLVGGTLVAGAVWAGSREPARVTTVVRSDVRTGKLVRSTVVSSRPVTETVISPAVVSVAVPAARPAPAPPLALPAGIDEAVERIAAMHALPPALLHSVIKVESNYNPYALSSKGAQGLMQLIPSTARRFGVADAFNPVQNIVGGARYLRYLLNLYHGNYPLALAAYNAGEANVARFGNRVPPFAETQNYVVLVGRELEELARKAAVLEAERKARESQAKAAEQKKGPGFNHITEVFAGDGTVRYITR